MAKYLFGEKMIKKQATCFLMMMFLLSHCREPYDPALENGVFSFLVVEGAINANGITTITLTRTQRISEKEAKKFETRATVEIEGDNNTRVALTDRGNGVYTSASNILPRDRRYRLRIKTSAGNEYLSEFTTVRVAQPVSATWTQDAEGVELMASTTDPTGQSRYYQWVTEETWEINSALPSYFEVVRTPAFDIKRRTGQDVENAFRCWNTLRAANILTVSTAAQSADVVSGFSLSKIPNGSEKLDVRYSMLVIQHAISREAFEFYEVLKKNTEQMGSVFDPQPSLVRGNIRCVTDPDETVIGFIESSVPSTYRIFITSEQAGNWQSSLVCPTTYVTISPLELRTSLRTNETAISAAVVADYPDEYGFEIILGYNIAKSECVDCRGRGNNVRPSFW